MRKSVKNPKNQGLIFNKKTIYEFKMRKSAEFLV